MTLSGWREGESLQAIAERFEREAAVGRIERDAIEFERRLKWDATAGQPRRSTPSPAAVRQWEQRAGAILASERSSLAGRTIQLVRIGLGYSFAAAADDELSRWYRQGRDSWRATTEGAVLTPRRDEWWYPAHSPITALVVLARTLQLWQLRDDAARLRAQYPARTDEEPYEDFDDQPIATLY